jgi:ubiquinone/menaquinone biosynthesis C-methylase UbiE
MSTATSTDTAKIAHWYDIKTQWEWERTHNMCMEFALTMRAVEEHAPPPPAAVLDLGSGPGRYAIALAERGYDLTLFDLSAQCLAFARQQATERGVRLGDCLQGSATDLSTFADGAFPFVLCMGPFYHLLKAAERQQALDEVRRVLAPGGVLVAAFLGRFAPARFWSHRRPEVLVRDLERNYEILETGEIPFHGDPEKTWVDAYCERPEAIQPWMEASGFTTVALLGAEGISEFAQDKAAELPAEMWPAYVEMNYRLAHEPSLLGAAQHLLYIGRKR